MNMRCLRQEKGLSVPALAQLCGLSRRTLQDIERRGDCLVSNAVRIAAALHVSIDEFCKEDTK